MNRKKSITFFLTLAACLSLGLGSIQSKAYTDEEKAYIKSMLQAYGYSPDMAGANQAYQDYLSGKYNDICEQYGLPKQNVVRAAEIPPHPAMPASLPEQRRTTAESISTRPEAKRAFIL